MMHILHQTPDQSDDLPPFLLFELRHHFHTGAVLITKYAEAILSSTTEQSRKILPFLGFELHHYSRICFSPLLLSVSQTEAGATQDETPGATVSSRSQARACEIGDTSLELD